MKFCRNGHFARECPGNVGAVCQEDDEECEDIDGYEDYEYYEEENVEDEDWNPDEHPVGACGLEELFVGAAEAGVAGNKEVLYQKGDVTIIKKSPTEGTGIIRGRQHALKEEMIRIYFTFNIFCIFKNATPFKMNAE